MKLLLLFLIWLPTTVFLFLFSLFQLNNYSLFYSQDKTLGYTIEAKDIYAYVYDENHYIPQIVNDQDVRHMVLKKFFSEYKSPLESYVDEIIYESDLYGLDYALIPAIAMQESGGCKVIPINSYNCWGFGIYGNKKVIFSSFDEAVGKVAKTIKEAYIKRGLTNATLLEDRWTPSSRGQWSYSVNYFIGKIREYEKNITSS